MKTVRMIATVFAAMMLMASCSPSAEKMAQDYKELTVELAKAKMDGDEKKVEAIKKKMEKLNEKIGKEAEREMKDAKREVKKAGKEMEKAFEDLVK